MEDLENKIIVKCDNGFQWIRLDTSREKNYESKAMGYCVTQDEEDDNEPIIYSLRDKDNIPHVTVEFDEESNEIEQIKGRDDTRPNEKYYDDILKFYQATGATNYYEIAGNQPYAIANGKIYIGDNAILACPEDTVFDFVRLGRNSKITEWNYSVSKDFNAYGSNLEYVNPKCRFGWNANISGTNIKEWHCNVGGDFDASGSKLEYVNPKCIFGGGVFTKIKEWDNDKFGGSVNVSHTNIKEWHNDVPGDFNVSHTNIKEWHCNVGGDFDASGSKLEYVNPKCIFGGKVDISGTNIKEWHNDVPKYFSAENSKLEYVNPKCKFGWCVDIRKTMVKEWHNDVPGHFYGDHSKLEYINPDCKFRDITLKWTKIYQFKDYSWILSI